MATLQETSSFDYQNFYETTLSADITASATDIFLATVPTGDEGTLIIDPDSAANREIIYYNSKTATKVVCPSEALGRGYDGTTATSHTTGTKVIMAPIADWFNSLRALFTTTPTGYTSIATLPTTIVANGNRSYTCTIPGVDYTGVLSAGMRLKLTRTVTAPIQCTSLNGTTQYYNKTSPNAMTFTDDFVASAWIKLSAYPATGTIGGVVSRTNGTSGWELVINASGQIAMQGFNASLSNYSNVQSYQSVPLNKWVHITAQLDMSAFTATTTTSYVMIDGVDVPASVARSGTNPTALIQAGNLEIGSSRGGAQFFPGKIAQVAIYNAKVTQATVKASISQTLTGSETSLISAYSFNNSITDLNANANNLTANGSAVATNADSPFGLQADGTTAGTTEYAIITKTAFSTDTTLTVQVPEGNAIPTTGGVSAVSYSTQKAPYGMPIAKGKWRITSLLRVTSSTTSNATFGAFQAGGYALTVPVGAWDVGHRGCFLNATTTTVFYNISSTALTGLTAAQANAVSPYMVTTLSSAVASYTITAVVTQPQELSAAATYVMYTLGATTSANIDSNATNEIFAELTLL